LVEILKTIPDAARRALLILLALLAAWRQYLYLAAVFKVRLRRTNQKTLENSLEKKN